MPKGLLKKHIEKRLKKKKNLTSGAIPLEATAIGNTAGWLIGVIGGLIGLGGNTLDRAYTKGTAPLKNPGVPLSKRITGKIGGPYFVPDYEVMRGVAKRVAEGGIDVNLRSKYPSIQEYRAPLGAKQPPRQVINFPPQMANAHLLANQLGEAEIMRDLPLLSRLARSKALLRTANLAPLLGGATAAAEYVFSDGKDRGKRAVTIARTGATIGAVAASPVVLNEGLSLAKAVKNLYRSGMRPARIMSKALPTLGLSTAVLAPILAPIVGAYLGAEILEDKIKAGKLSKASENDKKPAIAAGGKLGRSVGGDLGVSLGYTLGDSPESQAVNAGIGGITGIIAGHVVGRKAMQAALAKRRKKSKKK